MKLRSLSNSLLLASLISSVLTADLAIGQEASRAGSELDLLRNDEIRKQLGLSTAQEEKLAEAAKAGGTDREAFELFRERMRTAATKEEQTKLREELQQATAKLK